MISRSELLNDAEEAMRQVLDGRQVEMWTALPGLIENVDFDAMTCTVQPTLKATIVDENGGMQSVKLPLLIHVPIVFPSAGGFTITMPLKKDDEVLVVFSCRSIDSWWQSGGIQEAVEARMHDLSDGFAIPGPKSTPNVISNISSTALQIRNDSGDSYVEISADGKIKLVSTSEIDVTGNLKVTGDISASGNITTMLGDVQAGTPPISLKLHTHISATPGSPTGPALP